MRQFPLLTFLLTLLLVSLACGSGTALPATPEPATVDSASPVPENSPISPERTATELPIPTAATQTIPFSGLMVTYIREGNLWFWSETIPPQFGGTSGPHQMTDSGDLTDVCISDNGQLLAFVRGTEIWTARTDGTEARVLVTRTVPGGRLKFSPNSLLLAVSGNDQIQLVDVTTSAITTVLTYPAIPSGYEPEVVWTQDALGFKTIIPAAEETGQAEFFFVFTTGTAASLAKFQMVPPDEGVPFLSPDGGYVIYVVNVADDQNSLYLMDSSGATKPYGEPADIVKAYGWLPDSKHFVYAFDTSQRAFMGNVSGQPDEITMGRYNALRWIDSNYFLGLESGSLYLDSISGERTQIASGVSKFDFSQ